jgi:hypothetical protein
MRRKLEEEEEEPAERHQQPVVDSLPEALRQVRRHRHNAGNKLREPKPFPRTRRSSSSLFLPTSSSP